MHGDRPVALVEAKVAKSFDLAVDTGRRYSMMPRWPTAYSDRLCRHSVIDGEQINDGFERFRATVGDVAVCGHGRIAVSRACVRRAQSACSTG